MHFTPALEEYPPPFSLFKSCTAALSNSWLSTISTDRINNLAHYNQWQTLAFDPPMVMFARDQRPKGRRKDKVLNAEDVIYSEVMRIDMVDEVILPSSKFDISNIQPIARTGYYKYARVSETFEMRVTSASMAAENGLVGKSILTKSN